MNPQEENVSDGSLDDAPKQVGVDAGASLAKLAVRTASGRVHYETIPCTQLPAVVSRIHAWAPERVGLTGCGARAIESGLAERGAHGARRFQEFDTWGAGAHAQLAEEAGDLFDEAAPYLLISLGTGTSVMRVERGQVMRVGGTALGGGTVLGLGVALTGCESFEQLCTWATQGDRAKIDLLVSDIYEEGEIPLPGETTASAFGSLSRWLAGGRESSGAPSREDLATGVMSLVAENVGLVCAGVSAMTQTRRWVFGGSTLDANPAMQEILLRVATNMGMDAHLLRHGAHAGARGALELAGSA